MKRLTLATVLILYVIAGNGVSLAQSREHKRNPFAPLDKRTAPQSARITKRTKRSTASDENNLQLNGIIWNSSGPMAIIDNTVVMVGSEIAGRKVVAISVDRVEVDYRGKKETLTIRPKILFSVTKTPKHFLSLDGVSSGGLMTLPSFNFFSIAILPSLTRNLPSSFPSSNIRYAPVIVKRRFFKYSCCINRFK